MADDQMPNSWDENVTKQYAENPFINLLVQQNAPGNQLGAARQDMMVSAMGMATSASFLQSGFPPGRNRTANFTLDNPLLLGQVAESTMDSELRLHSHNNKPAIIIRDANTGIIASVSYAWHGVRVPAFVITNPERITVDMIDVVDNAEIRRVMITMYGFKEYLSDCGAKLIHKDKTGELYRKDFRNEEPFVFVKVTNSTPEPDGWFKDYFLRVPPTMKNATEAVAWTFRMSPEEYKLALET